jgi:hypothetical protein
VDEHFGVLKSDLKAASNLFLNWLINFESIISAGMASTKATYHQRIHPGYFVEAVVELVGSNTVSIPPISNSRHQLGVFPLDGL